MTTGVATFERRLSPDAERTGGTISAVGEQTRAELLKFLRAPDFIAPVVVLPTVLFLLFGLPNARHVLPDGSSLGPHLVASFGVYGLLSVVLFSFGEAIATERGQGWLRLVRATPLPPAVFLTAKLLVGLVLALLVVALLFPVAALAGGVRLAPDQWLRLGALLVLGALPLAPIGFLIGFWARPSSAGAIALLILLPVSYLSGSWQPVETLPEAVRGLAQYLPTYHYAELARAAIGRAPGDVSLHLAWVLASAVVFAGLALWGYRRGVGRQFA